MTFENLQVGLKNSVAQVVTADDTALAVGSGSLKVLAKPKMLALIEKAAADLIELHLPENFTSVGISLNVNHTAPTPVGMKIRAESEIIAVDGRKIILNVAAYDEAGEIGNGVHERLSSTAPNFS